MTATSWVEDNAGLGEVERALAGADELALDTEANSMFAYRERMCLVQLHCLKGGATQGELSIIDPLAFPSPREALKPVIDFFESGRRVLLHGGEYDVAILKRELGCGPKVLFDTQQAASLLGFERTGYASLVEELLGVSLTKTHQQFNWGKRPIPESPRRYAYDDVRYLPEIAKILTGMVEEVGIREEVELACQAVAEMPAHSPSTPEDRFWKLAFKTKLKGSSLKVLHSLFMWREHAAEQRDEPPGRLIPNEVLRQLALERPQDPKVLQKKGLSRTLLQQEMPALLRVLATESSTLPPKPAHKVPDDAVRARESKLKTWRQEEADKRGVTLQVVLPSKVLESLARGDAIEDQALMGEGRRSRYGAALKELLL